MYGLAFEVMNEIAFCDSGVGVNLSHIAERYSIPRSTFTRHIRQMREAGLIVRVGHGRYSLPFQFAQKTREFYPQGKRIGHNE